MLTLLGVIVSPADVSYEELKWSPLSPGVSLEAQVN